MSMCSVQGIRLSHIGTTGLEIKFRIGSGRQNVSNSGTLRRQKAASTCLLSVRPDMPRLALVQLSGDFDLHLRLFTLLYMTYTDL